MPKIVLLLPLLVIICATVKAEIKPVVLCPGQNIAFGVVNQPGKTYQWQLRLKDSAVYINLSDNASFTGSTSSNLQVINAGTHLYGSAIRCIISGASGITIPDTNYLKIAVSWTGAGNSQWHNPANWSCGSFPDQNTDVYIDSGAVLVNANAVCRSLHVKNPATVQIGTGYTLEILNKKSREAVLHDNVRVIDSSLFSLNPDTSLLDLGIYEFSFMEMDPAFAINEIIVGEQSGGYARRITDVSKQPNKTILQTSQASLGEIFKEVEISVKTNSNPVAPAGPPVNASGNREQHDQGTGFNVSLANIPLFYSPGYEVKIASGNFHMDADWDFDFKYKDSRVEYFNMTCNNLQANVDMVVRNEMAGALVIPKFSKSVELLEKGFWVSVPVGPLVVPLYFEFGVELKAGLEAHAFGQSVSDIVISSQNSMNAGIRYQNGQFQTIFEPNYHLTVSNGDNEYVSGHSLQTSLGAEVSLRLFKVLGPYYELNVVGESEARFNSSVSEPGLWDFRGEAYLENRIGLNAEIMVNKSVDLELIDFSKQWKSFQEYFFTPFKIQKATTGELAAAPGAFVPQPIQVLVVDNLGLSQPYVNVFFKVTNGGGTVDSAVVKTNADGLASAKWKLGPEDQPLQELSVYSLDGNSTLLSGAPLSFKANLLILPTVTTAALSAVSGISARSGGNVLHPGAAAVTSRGVCWTTNNINPPTIADSKTTNGSGIGNFTSTISNLQANTTYYVRAYAINSKGVGYGETVGFTTVGTDEVVIGTQRWKTKNLDVVTYRNGDTIPQVTNRNQWDTLKTGAWCYYNNDPAMGAIYGKIYNAYAAKDPRGLAPVGWRVPYYYDFIALRNYLGVDSAGEKMKAVSNLWLYAIDPATVSGFDGLPGGWRISGDFSGNSLYGAWHARRLDGESGHNVFWIIRTGRQLTFESVLQSYGFYVRCIKE